MRQFLFSLLGYRPPPPKYHYQPPPTRKPPTTRPPRQRTSERPVEVILTAVQASTQRPSARSGSKPAFKLANKTSMNLDGPGYALTLLLVGDVKYISLAQQYGLCNTGQIVILGMAFMNGLGSSNNSTSRSLVTGNLYKYNHHR